MLFLSLLNVYLTVFYVTIINICEMCDDFMKKYKIFILMPYKNSEQQAALIHEDLIQTVTHLNDSVNCVTNELSAS